MKLIKKPSSDKCNAMRCKTPTSLTRGARAFCDLHGAKYSKAMEPLPDDGQAHAQEEVDAVVLARTRADVEASPLPDPEILDESTALAYCDKQTTATVIALTTAAFVRALEEDAAAALVVLSDAQSLVIQDQEDFTFVEEAVAETKADFKSYEARRTGFTQPANAMLRKFNSWFKPVTNALKETEKVLKGKLSTYRREQEAKEQELIAAARVAETPAETKAALVAAATAMPTTSSTSYVDNWVFEIEDEFALPRELLMPDEGAIKAQVKLLKNRTDIPGVRVWNEPTVRSSAKKA